MKILSALFDAALLPLAAATDLVNPWPMLMDGRKSATRRKIEEIEENLSR